MKDWKTTFFGLVAGGFGFVIFAPEHFQQWPWLISFAKFAAAGGLTGLGITAAQANKKG
jgi:hypothetical protein